MTSLSLIRCGAPAEKNVGDSYRDLVVWQRSIQLAVSIKKLTEDFPKTETYGLTSQMRRAGVSIASNIAEGYGRGTRGEYKQFLGIARGSNCELQTQCTIAREIGYGRKEVLTATEGLSLEVGRMLTAILRKLRVD